MFNLNNIVFPKPIQFNITQAIPIPNASISANISFNSIKNIAAPKLFAPEVCMQIKTPDNKIFTKSYIYVLFSNTEKSTFWINSYEINA